MCREIRFLPILLTSATAIGGLVSSTLLARLVTPVMHKLIPPHLATLVPDSRPLMAVKRPCVAAHVEGLYNPAVANVPAFLQTYGKA